MVTLTVKKRDTKENLYNLRKGGNIPAVFYGPKEDATPITISQVDFDKVWRDAGESTVITLKSDSGDHDAMIHDVDRDPVTGKSRHVDFYVIEKGKKIKVHVPVELDGIAPAVKELGGVLVKVLHEVEVEAFPKDLPHLLHADVSGLVDFEGHVVASEIKLPAGVSLITKSDEIVALVSAPREEKEEVVVDLASIEVEKKGKEAKDGEEEASADTK